MPSPAIHLWFGYPVPLSERLRLIRAAGFTAVSLWWEGRHQVPRLHLLPDLVRAADLRVSNLHVPFRDANALWADDTARREPVVARHLVWVEDCACHGIDMLVMHLVSGGERLPAPNAAGLDSLGRIVAAAEARGVTIAVENTRRPDYLTAVLEAIPSPRLGLCFDTAHDRLWSPEPVALPRRWRDRLALLHCADTEGRMDRHLLPGDGIVDWPSVAAAIPDNYAGDLLLEVMPYGTPGLSAEEFLAEAYRRAAWVQSLITAC